MANFTDLFIWFDKMGLADSLIPFMLIFTITYAVLDRIKLFGDSKKNIHIILAMILGLLFVIPHVTNSYPTGADPVEIINTAVPNVGVLIIAIIMVMLIVGVFGAKLKVKNSPLTSIVVLVAFGLVLYIFGQAAGWWNKSGFPRFFGFLNDPETMAMIVILAVFLIFVFFLVGGSSEGNAKNGLGSFLDYFKGMLE